MSSPRTSIKSFWPFIALAVLAFIIHLSFLSYPSQVVFDEVHFGKFVAAYSTGQYYFDIHPPLGKMMIAGFAELTNPNLFSERTPQLREEPESSPSTSSGNKDSSVFSFNNIGEQAPANMFFTLRFLPAFFGGLFVLAFAWLAYLITRNKTAALIAGFLILLDNGVLVQSKFILVDIFLLFFEILTLCFFFLWQRQKNFGAKWFGYLFITAIFAGLTISIKWTGVAIIGIIGVVLFTKIFSKKLRYYLEIYPSVIPAQAGIQTPIVQLPIKQLNNSNPGSPIKSGMTKRIPEIILSFIVIFFIAFLVYLLPFYLHFRLLPNSGPGDAFMSQPFQQELKYGRANVYQPLNFWQKFVELNKTMYTANAGISSQHPFGSKWYSWPLNSKPVYYWNQETFNNLPNWKAKIYLSGNPLLWLLGAGAIIFTIFRFFTKFGRRSLSPIFWILLLGYFANLLPFIFISRVAFLYHYLPPVIYAILILGLLLSNLWPAQKKIVITIITVIALSFALVSPLSYGWPLPPAMDKMETGLINIFH